MKPSRNDSCPCGSGKKYKHCCERKTKGSSSFPLIELNRLNALLNTEKYVEVESELHKWLGHYSEETKIWELLATVLRKQKKDALFALQKIVELIPSDANGHINLGNALKDVGQLEKAANHFCIAAEIQPDNVVSHGNLATTLMELGQLERALDSFGRAVEVKPDFAAGRSNLLFVLNYTELRSALERFTEAISYGKMVASKVTTRYTTWQCDPQPQRLRVGIVSGDLRTHSVAHFLENLLIDLDTSRVELIAYTNNPISDDLTTRIKPYFSQWREVFTLNDQAAAQLIHDDGIHILIDLSGHTAKNRLPVFAWKPAPVQVSWLGYFASTGMTEINYLLADKTGVPDDQRSHFCETIWYLPDTRLCFTPPDTDLPVAPLPSLSNGHITFGCYQNLAKVTDAVLAVWGRIFAALPNARLHLMSQQLKDPSVVLQLHQRLEKCGITQGRALLHSSLPRAEYLASHANVDILLDTYPYPGGTTTCESLWMGVPTLTLAGNTLLSRQGASLLTAAGLPDWIANNEDDCVAKAVHFASDLPKLATLRAGLRERVRTSPLFDAPRFAKHFEQALWGMWQANQHKIRA